MSVKKQSNKYAISVADVIKVYRLCERPIDHLKGSMSISYKNYHRDFYALNQFFFRVRKRETVEIIGTDGSDKSIILKIITGVPTPVTGEIEVDGKISALLELGAGFNIDYTGIENIYMNDIVMGYTKKEMDAEPQGVLEFTEVGDFVYQPVKTHFSNMFVRLAFALVINVDPEILIMDEAPSVSDVFLQSKHYRRMEEIRRKGTITLTMTHDMGSTIKYCDRAVLLSEGEFIVEGLASRVVDMYKKILTGQLDSLKAGLERERQQKESLLGGSGQEGTGNGQHTRVGTEGGETAWSRAGAGIKSGDVEMSDFSGDMGLERNRPMKGQLIINYDRTKYRNNRAEIVDLGLFDERGNTTNLLLKGETFTIKEWIRLNTGVQSPISTYTVKDKKNTGLTGTNTMFEGADIQSVKHGDGHVVELIQKMTLQGGEYLLNMNCIGFERGEHMVCHRLYDVADIAVVPNKSTIGVYDMESKVRAEKMEAGNTQAGNACPTVNGGL